MNFFLTGLHGQFEELVEDVKFRWRAFVARRRKASLIVLNVMLMTKFREAAPEFADMELHIRDEPGRVINYKHQSPIYWDTPVCYSAFVTIRNLDPAVHFGMGLEVRGCILLVRQLQGVHGAPIPAALKRWPRIFLHCVQDYVTRSRTFRAVHVVPAELSGYYDFPAWGRGFPESERDGDKHRTRLHLRYDITAKRLGFIRRGDRFVWTPK